LLQPAATRDGARSGQREAGIGCCVRPAKGPTARSRGALPARTRHGAAGSEGAPMKYAYSLCVAVALVLVCVAGRAYLFSNWAGDHGLDVWNLPALAVQVQQGERRADEWRSVDATIMAHIRGREKVAADVIERRLTLLEAAARCRELALAAPAFRWD